MKFANKLFFMTTALLTAIFAVFGSLLISSYCDRTLQREIEQASIEDQMYVYLFGMTYRSMTEYGDDYATKRAANSVCDHVEENGNYGYIWSENDAFPGREIQRPQQNIFRELATYLVDADTYSYGIRQLGGRYYLMSVSRLKAEEETLYLGVSKDVTFVYESRRELLNQYRIALVLLVLSGGICIYMLAYYITKPIRTLEAVVGEIAEGNYEMRSTYKGNDEIGTLASNLNRMADRLMKHMEEKENEAKQKEEFTTAFAHELKTPLTSIIGYADMLNSLQLTQEEQSEAYYYIYHQGKRLEHLWQKLLELSYIENTELRMRHIRVKELEDNLKVTMRPMLEQKNIKGRFCMEKGTIYGDKDLLLSVLYNLIDNAIKAVREDGYILLKGVCTETGYEIKITDNGCGIPACEIERITEAFYMVDKSRSRKEGGAGIGMTLCQKIILLHRAKMEIFSKEGEGTTILLRFPAEEECI